MMEVPTGGSCGYWIFLHIPKCGGETLERALRLEKDYATAWERRKEWNEDTVVFTIVRNPFDRMLAWFRFCLHGWNGELPKPDHICLRAHEIISRQGGDATLDSVQVAFQEWL